MGMAFTVTELAAIARARVVVLAPRARILRRIDRVARRVAARVERVRRAHAGWCERRFIAWHEYRHTVARRAMMWQRAANGFDAESLIGKLGGLPLVELSGAARGFFRGGF